MGLPTVKTAESNAVHVRLTRVPAGVLRPFVRTVWAMDQAVSSRPGISDREFVLPTGGVHLAFRLSDRPVRLFEDPGDLTGRLVGIAVVGGPRVRPYIRDVSPLGRSLGAQLCPGACELVLGVPADKLAGGHSALEDFWGRDAVDLRERLLEADAPEKQLEILESFLAARLPRVHGLNPAVAHALERFATTANVAQVVRETGYSHRRFIALFRHAVGLSPKLYCRLQRFQRALGRMAAEPNAAPVEVALKAGYSDQPHFNREFRDFGGMTPGEYGEFSPMLPYHVPLPPLRR